MPGGAAVLWEGPVKGLAMRGPDVNYPHGLLYGSVLGGIATNGVP